MIELNHFEKGAFSFAKGHSDNPEGQVEVETSLNRKLFLKSLNEIKKKNFFQKGHF